LTVFPEEPPPEGNEDAISLPEDAFTLREQKDMAPENAITVL
jgi:hypothetical protein